MTDAKPELRLVEPSDAGLATLELISTARQALAQARTLPDIRRVMEAASVAADAAQRAAKLFNAERRATAVVEAATAAANDASAVRIEAQAKAGELLKQMTGRGERAERGRPEKMSQAATFIDSGGERRSLRSLGVSRSESSRWQQVADVPEEVREDYVEETKAAKGEVSTAGLLRHAAARVGPAPAARGARSERSSGNRDTAPASRQGLADELHRALNALPTYPPALIADLDGDERKDIHRTARRVAQWFGYLMAELRRGAADRPDSDFERVEAAYTAVYDLHGLCSGPTGVRAIALVDAVEAEERAQLLGAVRDVRGWLADLEGELSRQGAERAERDGEAREAEA